MEDSVLSEERKPPKKPTMLMSLRVLVLLLVVVVALLVFIVTFTPLYISGEETGEEFSETARIETSARVASESMAFFSVYHTVVQSMNSLTRFYALNVSDEHDLMQVVCNHYRRVNQSSYLGLTDGRFVKCESFDGGITFHSQVRYITFRDTFILDRNYSVLSERRNLSLSPPFDSRARPWYAALNQSNGYSNLYKNFSDTNESSTVITAGGPVFDRWRALIGVFAIDVFPVDVLEYFNDVRLTSGEAYLCEAETLNLLGGSSPGFGESLSRNTQLVSLQDTVEPVLSRRRAAAIEAMLCSTDCFIAFGRGRNKGYVGSRTIDPKGILRLRVLVVTQEKYYLGSLWERTDISIGVVSAVIVALLTVGVIFTNLVLAPLRALSEQLESMGELEDISGDIKFSMLREINSLQLSFQRVSGQLQQLKGFVPQNILEDDEWSVGARSVSDYSGELGEFEDHHPNRVPAFNVPVVENERGEEQEGKENVPAHDPTNPFDADDVESTEAHPRRNSEQEGGGKFAAEQEDDSSDADADGPRRPSPKPMVTWGKNDTVDSNNNRPPVPFTPSTKGSLETADDVSFKLNNRRLQQEINRFKMRRSTILIAELALYRLKTRQEIEVEVAIFMEAVIGNALMFRGTVQLIRPEVIVVSFSTIMHESKAVKAALSICGMLRHCKLLSVALDSGEYFIGNCGAKGRFANAIFGPMFEALRHLPDLVRHYHGTSLIMTESVAKAARIDGFSMFPVDILTSRFVKTPIQLYDIAPAEGYAADLCKKAFGLMHSGSLEEAQALLDFGAETNPHCNRLRNRIAAGNGQRMRKNVFPWEDLGDLQSVGDTKVVAYFASRLSPETEDGSGCATGLGASSILMNQSGAVRDKLRQARKELRSHDDNRIVGSPEQREDNPPEPEDNGMFMFMPVTLVSLKDDEYDTSDTTNNTGTIGCTTESAPQKSDSMRIPDEFSDLFGEQWHRSRLVLGKGGFGEVFQGMSDTGVFAAMKFIQLTAEMKTRDLETEMDAFIKLQHENIVQYYAAAVLPRHLVFILEYVPGGSLVTVMEAYGGQLPHTVARKFTLDILRGMRYLHSEEVVHCDIKPHNVLVAGDGTCKITDFGSALLNTRDDFAGVSMRKQSSAAAGGADEDNEMEDLRGTLKYMAPEVADSLMPTKASDMWSFGISVYQLYAGKLPWEHVPTPYGTMAFLNNLGSGKWRPQVSPEANLPSGIREMVTRCWAHDPDQRPTARDLLADDYFA